MQFSEGFLISQGNMALDHTVVQIVEQLDHIEDAAEFRSRDLRLDRVAVVKFTDEAGNQLVF